MQMTTRLLRTSRLWHQGSVAMIEFETEAALRDNDGFNRSQIRRAASGQGSFVFDRQINERLICLQFGDFLF